jgi:hypothetical protein
MGGNTANTNLEHFDLLKDLELARNNLKERAKNTNKETELENTKNLPLEEMKYIEWRSDTHDPYDNEGFLMVSRKKYRKRRKKKSPMKVKNSKLSHPNMMMGRTPLRERCLDFVLDIISGKQLLLK